VRVTIKQEPLVRTFPAKGEARNWLDLMRENMQTNAVTDALRMARFRRRPEPSLFFQM